MINRAVKNYLLLPILTAGLLLVFLFVTPRAAQAIELNTVFDIDESNRTTRDVYIDIDGYTDNNPGLLVGATEAVLRVHIKMSGDNGNPGKDINSVDGIIDSYDMGTKTLGDRKSTRL